MIETNGSFLSALEVSASDVGLVIAARTSDEVEFAGC